MRVPSGSHLLRQVRSDFKRRKKRPGAAPGTLIYDGSYESETLEGPVRLHVFDYDAEHLEERELEGPEDCSSFPESDTVTWIDVDGVHDLHVVERIGAIFGLHPLTLEDIVSTHQRPKLEEYPDYIYIVLQMIHYDGEARQIVPEQVSIVFGRGFLISFQESIEGDVFDPVRGRLREGRGVIRQSGTDFLAYTLIDLIVDYYMEVLEALGEHIEDLEDAIMLQADTGLLRSINDVRRSVTFLRRSIWPLRDVILALERSNSAFVTPDIDPFLRDVYDHTVRTVELIESAREILASLVELHLSAMSNRMNEVMKVLTIIATFFLPLSFIAGVYGMNFNPASSPLNMPELNWYVGYPFALGVMAMVALGMYLFFRRKGWF